MPTPRLRGPQVARRPETPNPVRGSEPGLDVAGGILQGVAQIAAREVLRADEMMTDELENEYLTGLEAELRDPQRGLLQQRGFKAIDAAEGISTRLDEVAARVERNARTDRQRELFRQRREALDRQAMAQVNAHVGNETRRFDTEQHEALLAQDRERLASLARLGRLDEANEVIARMSARIARYGDRSGTAPELVMQARKEAISGGRLVQLQSLLNNGKVDTAANLLAAHRDSMTLDARAQADQWLRTAQVTRDARTEVEKMLAAGVTSYADAEAVLGGIQDEAVRSEARKFFDSEMKRVRDARTHDAEDATRAASLMMQQAGAFAVFEEVVPATLRARMSPEQRRMVQSHADAPAQNNALKWAEFWMLSPEDRAELSDVKFLTDYWQYFDTPHRAKAETMMRESRQPEQADDIRTFQQQVETTAIASGIRPAGTMQALQARRYQQFIDLASREIDAARRDGKRMGFAERQELLDNLVRETRFDVGGNRPVGRWEITDDNREDARIPYAELEKEPDYLKKLRQDFTWARMNGSTVGPPTQRLLERLAAADYLKDLELRNRILYPERYQ